MGATCLDFKIYGKNSEFALPHQVFGFENVTKLCVSGCKIGRGIDDWISCRRLKSLALEIKRVFRKRYNSGDIISSCPMIENLSLSTTPDRLGLTTFCVNEFHKLEVLSLYGINFPPLYFDDFSCKLPCLKVLALNRCQLCKEISISSPSLECIDLNFIKYDIMVRLKFDVPRIRKFSFSGSKVPTLSLKTTKSNWESFITIQRRCPPSPTWFFELNKFLKSLSKVSFLNLIIKSEKTSEHNGEIRGVYRPEVQYLLISGPCSTCPALYYSLFQCCRPVYVTQYWLAKSCKPSKRRYDFVDFACKRLAHQAAFISCLAYQRMMSGECDLEEVNAQFYDESVSKWRRQLLDASTSFGDADERKTRLHLRWGR